MVGRDTVHRPLAGRERDADEVAPARARPGLTTPGAVVALQRGAGNAAVARAVIQRHPAAPAQLRMDPSQVQVKPEPGATDPMAIADVMTSEPEVGPPTVEPARKFGYTSNPTNLIFTWRVFDGADRQIKDQTSGLALVLSNEEVRTWVRRNGLSALGTWTVRLEKDDYFHDVTFAVSEGPSPGPALSGSTTQSFYNLRELPSETAPKLGELAGEEVPIKVDNKARSGGRTWYRVTLGAPTGKLPAGTSGWIVADAVVAVTEWDMFRTQLQAWEAANGEPLEQRITHLRQMCHDKDLPFDDVIGVKQGTEYANTRSFKRGEWELLRDSQQVRMPDGRVVDVYHLLVGLDVLPRKDESRSISLFPGVTRNVGQNYSAATWSGDIGAAAADAALSQDATWEKQNPGASESDKVERYYSTRVSDGDLYGDIDAWEITELQHATSGAPTSIDALLAAYYGGPVVASQAGVGTGMHVEKRKAAVENFLRHYGFGFGGPYAPLAAQPARDDMVHQIETFANVWLDNRDYKLLGQPMWRVNEVHRYSQLMGDRLLEWLEKLAVEVGART